MMENNLGEDLRKSQHFPIECRFRREIMTGKYELKWKVGIEFAGWIV